MTDEKALDDACGKLGELLKPAYISTLSPDVSGLVERLRKPSTNEPTMRTWDSIRTKLIDGNKGSLPRDMFESILGAIDEERSEAADALASLSLQVSDKDSALRLANEQWEGAIEILRESKARAETAEASLSAAQEENERLRAAIIKAVDPSSAGIGGIESAEDGVAYMAGVLLPALGIDAEEGKK